MEGYIAAIVLSGAALTVPEFGRDAMSRLLRLIVGVLAACSATAVVWAVWLSEWLTVSWGLGLFASCVAVLTPRMSVGTLQRLATLAVLGTATAGLGVSALALLETGHHLPQIEPLVHLPYRTNVGFILLGDGLLNVTAIAIWVVRHRRPLARGDGSAAS